MLSIGRVWQIDPTSCRRRFACSFAWACLVRCARGRFRRARWWCEWSCLSVASLFPRPPRPAALLCSTRRCITLLRTDRPALVWRVRCCPRPALRSPRLVDARCCCWEARGRAKRPHCNSQTTHSGEERRGEERRKGGRVSNRIMLGSEPSAPSPHCVFLCPPLLSVPAAVCACCRLCMRRCRLWAVSSASRRNRSKGHNTHKLAH